MSVQPENRGRWVFKVMHDLEKLQKTRFEGATLGKSVNLSLAWSAYRAKSAVERLAWLKTVMLSTETISDLTAKVAIFNAVKDGEEAQYYARQITLEESEIGSIWSDDDFVDIENDTIYGTESPSANVSAISQWWSDLKDSGVIMTVGRYFAEFAKYLIASKVFLYSNTLEHTIPQAISEALGAEPDYLMSKNLKSPVLLSLLPLHHVDSVEVARSGKILKFRATGSVFLANQEGGEDAVRIEGTIYRREIVVFLILWMIFLYGQGRTKEAQGLTTLLDTPTSLVNIRSKIHSILPYNKRTTKPSYEFHMTFPVVTRHVIIPNCYIETLSMEEKVVNGRDAYKYAILLRTYRRPTGFQVWVESPQKNYLVNKADKSLNMYKTIELAINQHWRYINANGVYVDHREWRLQSAKDNPVSEDRYYDLDAQDIAITTVMGVAGFF